MIKISCYKTLQDDLGKTFCKLAEKCYYAGLKVNVITENEDFTESLDRVLWTYSKKHFIAHATSADPLPDIHPVYITDDIEKMTACDMLILVNTTKQTILDISCKTNISQMQKILFLYDEDHKEQAHEIKNILQKSNIKDFELNSFIKNQEGAWQESIIS